LQLQKLQEDMQKLKSDADDQRDALANEVAERHDIILKLKVDLSSSEERHRSAVSQVQNMMCG
jgi:peptidoglycan hydrolase CwlO-like protein